MYCVWYMSVVCVYVCVHGVCEGAVGYMCVSVVWCVCVRACGVCVLVCVCMCYVCGGV